MEEDRKYRRVDDEATVEFRAYARQALETLKECFSKLERAFVEDKKEVSSKLDNHQDRITKIEGSLEVMVKIIWAVALCSISIVVAQIFKIIFK